MEIESSVCCFFGVPRFNTICIYEKGKIAYFALNKKIIVFWKNTLIFVYM